MNLQKNSGWYAVVDIDLRSMMTSICLILGLLGLPSAAVGMSCFNEEWITDLGIKQGVAENFENMSLSSDQHEIRYALKTSQFERLGDNIFALKVSPVNPYASGSLQTAGTTGELIWLEITADEDAGDLQLDIFKRLSLEQFGRLLAAGGEQSVQINFDQVLPYPDGSFAVLFTRQQGGKISFTRHVARFDSAHHLIWEKLVGWGPGSGVFEISRPPAIGEVSNPDDLIIFSGIYSDWRSNIVLETVVSDPEMLKFRWQRFDTSGTLLSTGGIPDQPMPLVWVANSYDGYVGAVAGWQQIRFIERRTLTDFDISMSGVFQQEDMQLYAVSAHVTGQTLQFHIMATTNRADETFWLGFGTIGQNPRWRSPYQKQLNWSNRVQLQYAHPGYKDAVDVIHLDSDKVIVRDGLRVLVLSGMGIESLEERSFEAILGADALNKRAGFPVLVAMDPDQVEQSGFDSLVAWINSASQLEVRPCAFDGQASDYPSSE
ncbi:hypothetical protein ACWJJH_21960 [Endozoicomonadaceae bacterium StTr2]